MRNLFLLIVIIITSSLATFANQEQINHDFFCGGSGTENDPYQICTVEELTALAGFVNAGNGNETRGIYYLLMNDLDLGYYLSPIGPGYNDGAGWNPIGRFDTDTATCFQGNFNGNHKVIYNLTINRPDESYIGLFGCVLGGVIQNLGLKNGNILGLEYVGSLVGANGPYSEFIGSMLVTNCFALCFDVQSITWMAGGLAGGSYGSIIANSYSNSNVLGEAFVGGIVGDMHQGSTLTNCYASGNVIGDDYVAGLSGHNIHRSTIINCIAANRAVIATSYTEFVHRISITELPNSPYNGGTYHNNYARNDMVLQSYGVDVEIIEGDPMAGISEDFATFRAFDFYNTDSLWHDSSLWSMDTATNPDVIWKIIDQISLPSFQWQGDNSKCLTQGVFFVDHTKSGDGSSWDDAYPNLADALVIAAKQHSGLIPVEPSDTVRAIYVAEGAYYPAYNADGYFFGITIPDYDGGRNNAFVLVPGVKLYGGFVPQDIYHGNFIPFGKFGRNGTTILSGNINGNNQDNAYHVVIGADIPEESNTLIEGFTISGGNADADLHHSITINGLIVLGRNGGGILNYNSSPLLNHVTISENTVLHDGGGMLNFMSSPTLLNVTIKGNSASNGGGIYNDFSSPVLTNVIMSGNSAAFGGGICNDAECYPVLTNVTISGNRANEKGGGISNLHSEPIINNSIIWGNEGSNVYNGNGINATFAYSLIEGSGGSSNWKDSFGIDGGNNIDADPLFVDPVPPSASPTTEGNYSFQCGSPATSAGSDSLYLLARNITSFAGETDVAGNPRLVDNHIDMGAYEPPKCLFPVFYVDHTKSGDGSSWEKAYPNLADPLILVAKQRAGAIWARPSDTIREIHVAEGAYFPMYNAHNYNFERKVFPETDGERDNAFVLVAGIKMYGGFVPGEIPSGMGVVPDFGTTGRNGITELSGNINGNNTNNAHHVLIGVDIPENSNTLIDGFTITGGNGNNINTYPVFVNGKQIQNNLGGGMHNLNASPALNHIDFHTNIAYRGGGIYNDASSPVLTHVFIRGNRADNGGGIYNDASSPTITNVAVSGNRATVEGGGIYNISSSPVLTNVTISGNKSGNLRRGGGIYNNNASPVINNSIIWGNETTNIFHFSAGNTSTFAHSLIGGSGGSDNWSALLGIDKGNNIDTVPFFVAPISPTLSPTIAGDYNIKQGSSCISAGNNLLYLTARGIDDFTGETDLAGIPRLIGHTIDMGAYEYPTKRTIIAISRIGGTIEPEGTITVYEGGDQTFNITPAFCYEIDRVLVDEVNNAAAVETGTYTFTNVLKNHTIRVFFKLIDYTTPVSVLIGFGETYDFHGRILSEEGTYYHTLRTVHGCDSTIVLTLTIGEGVSVKEIIDVPTEALVGSHKLYGTVIPENATYKTIVWSIKDTGTTEARLATRITLIAPKEGTVIVTATIANGLAMGVAYTQDFAIEVRVPYNSKIQYVIYPNPTTGELTIKNLNLNIEFEKISIYDIMGKRITSFEPIYEEPANEGIILANLAHVSAGVYFVVITTEKKVVTSKVVKR